MQVPGLLLVGEKRVAVDDPGQLRVRPHDHGHLQRRVVQDPLLDRGGDVRLAAAGPEDGVAALDVRDDVLVAELGQPRLSAWAIGSLAATADVDPADEAA